MFKDVVSKQTCCEGRFDDLAVLPLEEGVGDGILHGHVGGLHDVEHDSLLCGGVERVVPDVHERVGLLGVQLRHFVQDYLPDEATSFPAPRVNSNKTVGWIKKPADTMLNN